MATPISVDEKEVVKDAQAAHQLSKDILVEDVPDAIQVSFTSHWKHHQKKLAQATQEKSQINSPSETSKPFFPKKPKL